MGGESSPHIGDPWPRIELYDLQGNKVDVHGDFGGKIIIIRFWGDCCSFNTYEMSRIDQVYRKYEEKGLRIVTIHTGGTRKVAEGFVSMLKIKFPVLIDADSKAAKRYGVSKLPCTFILDQDGVVRTKIIGQVEDPVKTYEEFVTPLLNRNSR